MRDTPRKLRSALRKVAGTTDPGVFLADPGEFLSSFARKRNKNVNSYSISKSNNLYQIAELVAAARAIPCGICTRMTPIRSSCWFNPLVARMPRRWPQQCRLNPAHTGPFSRKGLCSPCRQALLRESGKNGSKLGGGRPRHFLYEPPRSQQPLARRGRRATTKQQQANTA